MRIHRTTPTRAFSVFSNALLRDRSLSWCAVGVLTYLLSLPNGARATIRTLAEQRKEGRARIAAALHELEESRYLRRVVRKDEESGQFSTVYEVFDTPYEDEPPAGESEEVQNRASGESESVASGALPSGEKTREEEPPSPPSADAPSAGTEAGAEVPPGESEAPPGERTALAARLLGSLRRTDPRLALGAAEALRLAPLVEEWWAAGASSAQVRAALTQGLPSPLYSPRAIVEDRLRRKCPAAPAAPADPAAAVGESAGSTAVPVTTVEIRKPGASGGYREAARRGGALARALLQGRPAPA
ncbi:hypothetical protein [Streptomyces sp. NBC_00576]|uniref:hypothetical protein n=1 Tax=Streptomyces sp. NBC_00576 TaxID=2903665 RepID=UPI002E80339B|nr:hypothetical protein [Streptomyces sp. NBC_00576]WUB73254.1 hypothetical protein OG734_26000 [Streptomyces sp. NBC_00576]